MWFNMKREPKFDWHLTESPININADIDYQGSMRGLLLPKGLSKEQTDLLLWAFETGFYQGKHKGESDLQREIKKLLSIPQ